MSAQDPQVVIVRTMAMGAEAMTSLDRHDPRHRIVRSPYNPMGHPGDRPEPLDGEGGDRLGGEHERRSHDARFHRATMRCDTHRDKGPRASNPVNGPRIQSSPEQSGLEAPVGFHLEVEELRNVRCQCHRFLGDLVGTGQL